MKESKLVNFSCECKKRKEFRLIFDGGCSGMYQLDLCSVCYANQDRRFLIAEEGISN